MKHYSLAYLLLTAVMLAGVHVAAKTAYVSTDKQTEYVTTLEKIDSLSRVVLDNNDVFDIDGSDDAAALLELYVKLDKLKKQYLLGEIPANYLVVPYIYGLY